MSCTADGDRARLDGLDQGLEDLLILLRRLLRYLSFYVQKAVIRPWIANRLVRRSSSSGTSFENEISYSLGTQFFLEPHGDPFIAVVISSIATPSRMMLAVSEGTRASAVARSQRASFPSLVFRLTRLPELNFKEKRST
jgi:hypothetical protein